jgi:hypothetical protein
MNNADKQTININFKFKEKNRSPQDYKAVMLALFKGLSVFRDTLKQLDSKELISSDLMVKLTDKFDLFNLEDRIDDLRILKTSAPPKTSSPIAVPQNSPPSSLPTTGLTLIRPKSLSKDELKDKIVELARIQNEPEFDFDLLVTATRELLNHSDVTVDEKSRYEIYFNEVVEYRNYKMMERGQSPPVQSQQPQQQPVAHQQGFTPIPAPSKPITSMSPLSSPAHSKPVLTSNDYPDDRSTSISIVRKEMAQQLQKLRQTFNTPSS